MKACVMQPPYSMNLSDADRLFEWKLDMLRLCDESMDIIVLPEYSDTPCKTDTWEETYDCYKKYSAPLLSACAETARRCSSILFVNGLCETETGFRNTTYAFDRKGNIVGKYFKKHLPPSELYALNLDQDYTREFSEPYVLELEGLRFGFLTCYDFYFYEAYAAIARKNVDIIIGCSLQRSDSHSALEIMGRFCAYNCNAHLVRASVSLSPDSDICGASMIVTPRGEVLVNMKSETGLASAEFDPKDKYYKPAGFGGEPAPHYEYIEFGRNPWQYRPGGSAIVKNDIIMPYPRICAYGGLCSSLSQNSLASFGAAVGMGADEIGFDLLSKDGELVSYSGFESSENIKYLRFEDVLQKFSCHAVMNIRIKSCANMQNDKNFFKKLIQLIDIYDCQKYVYFTSPDENVLALLKELAPTLIRCVECDRDSSDIISIAEKYDCKKIQLQKPFYDKGLIAEAHKKGLRCNAVFPDDQNEALHLVDMGIDTIITENFEIIYNAFKERDIK